jgi:hypothetical protein
MRLSSAVALILAASGLCRGQQPQVEATVTYTLTWINAATGDQSPLSPGQSATISMTATLTPAVNTVVPVLGVFPSTTLGTLRGIQSMFVDLVVTGNAAGTWSNLHLDETWDLLGSSGHGASTAGGTRITNIQAGQFPANWATVNATNPIVNIWKGDWTPANYIWAWTTFTVENGNANPSPFASNVLVNPSSNSGGPVYVGSAANGFGFVTIPAIPAPSALCLLGFGLLASARHRKR